MKKSILTNQLYDKRKQNQPWRQYSPGKKRMRVTNIPFMGQISNIKAQGTKVAPVLANKFSYFDNTINFAAVPASYYTKEEFRQLTPEEQREAIYEEAKRKKRDRREVLHGGNVALKQTRGFINAAKGVSGEIRGWTSLLGSE